MTFYEVLEQVLVLLQRHGRASYRALKRQFDLDDAYIADLQAEIIEVQRLAVDQDNTMLVWTGGPAPLPPGCEPHTWLACRCSLYHQHTAFYPITDLLQRVLQFSRDDTPAARWHKLEAGLAPYGLALPEVVPLLAMLLSVSLPESYSPSPLAPQRQKQKMLEALLLWLLRETERQPVLCVVDDLHWVDPSTLEFLNLLVDQAPTARLCLLLTCRAPFRPPWTPHTHVTHITLHRLPHAQVEHMIEQVAGGKALPHRGAQATCCQVRWRTALCGRTVPL